MLRLLKKISRNIFLEVWDTCVRGCVGLKYTDISFIWFIFGIMPRLRLKNDCPSEIIIEIDYTENCHTASSCHMWRIGLNGWLKKRKAGIDSRGSSESCTWEYAVVTRHRDHCMIKHKCQLLRSIVTKSFKEVCCSWLLPWCPQAQSRIAVGTSTGFVKHYSVSYQTLNCTKGRESKESFIIFNVNMKKKYLNILC